MDYKNIICPIDGSELGDKALDEAVYISKVTGAKLTLLHIVEKWYQSAHLVTDSDEWQAIHKGWLDKGKGLLEDEADKVRTKGVKHIETVLRDGDASYEIIAAAVERKADLIVMASHRYSPVGKLFLGSIIDKVTKRSPCPVLWVFK